MLQSVMGMFGKNQIEKDNGTLISEAVMDAMAGVGFRSGAFGRFYEGENYKFRPEDAKSMSYVWEMGTREFLNTESQKKLKNIAKIYKYLFNAPHLGEPELPISR